MAGDDENAPEPTPTGPELAEALGAMAMVGTVKLPEFWPDSTALWFARADAQFRLKKITAEQTKFDHVITMLDSKTAAQVMDVLITPPDHPYTVLKERLTKTFALTKSEKASRIIDKDGLGDQTPTQCLTIMLNWVPAEEQPGFLFREHFLRQLPSQVRTSLAQSTSTGSSREDLRALAEEADKYFRSMGARISAIQTARPGPVPVSVPGPSSANLDDWSRDQLVSAVLGKKTGLCRNHDKFGSKAWYCKSPCSWTGPPPKGRPGSGSGNSQPGQGRSH